MARGLLDLGVDVGECVAILGPTSADWARYDLGGQLAAAVTFGMVEQVRRFFVLDRDLSQEAGELTPTFKMKRKAIEEVYRPQFDRLYDDQSFGIEAEPLD